MTARKTFSCAGAAETAGAGETGGCDGQARIVADGADIHRSTGTVAGVEAGRSRLAAEAVGGDEQASADAEVAPGFGLNLRLPAGAVAGADAFETVAAVGVGGDVDVAVDVQRTAALRIDGGLTGGNRLSAGVAEAVGDRGEVAVDIEQRVRAECLDLDITAGRAEVGVAGEAHRLAGRRGDIEIA